jgi:RNA recognition motif-containing protein
VGKNLYVGNLAYNVRDPELRQRFAPHGTVQSAQVILDRETGRSRGFGFVEMSRDDEAQAAVAALHGKEVDGRVLTVREAEPRPEEPRRPRKGPARGRPPEVRKRPPALGRRLRRPPAPAEGLKPRQ